MTHDEVSHKELISLIRKHKEVFVTVNSIHDDLQVKAVKSELIKELKYELSEGRNDQWCVSYYADDNATLWIGA